MVFRLRREVYAMDSQRVGNQVVRVTTSLGRLAANRLTCVHTRWCPRTEHGPGSRQS
ncbi:hypothetical protein AB0D32_10215 [Micromonospora sp. NPDC048170]|uniref:hypothetical protein n=1 Tax=Micromonospora sp. NPDC048170 TaxID=3154819 RepID=UPI0033CC3414